MKTSQAFLILLFSFQSLALPHLHHRQSSNEAKEYPYCNDPDDPSISCDEKYPNGNFIDGNRPNPNEACSNIFFMCTNGKSTCFNCQILDDGTRLYYDHPKLQCSYKEDVTACVGVPDSTTTSLLTTSTTELTTTSSTTQPTTTSTTTKPTTSSTTTQPTTTSTTTKSTTASTTTQSTTSTSTTTEPTTSEVPTIPPGYECPHINGFFPIDSSKCLANYYVCVGGSPSIGTCPPESVFDPALLNCVLEGQASCNFECPANNGFYPVRGHENDQCFNGYITCVSFKAFPTLCPPKSVFDPDLLFCIPATSNGCPDIATTTVSVTGSTVSTTTLDPDNLCCPNVGQFPYPGSCTLYVICANDYIPIIATCRNGEVFNPSLAVCDDLENVPSCNVYSIADYYKALKHGGTKSGRDKCPSS